MLWNAGGEGDTFTEIFSTDANTLAYTKGALGLYAGQPFKFKIQAVNYQGISVASDSVRILAAEVPNSPGTPTKVEASKAHITIRWTLSTYNGGVPIETYKVYAKTQGAASYDHVHTVTELADLSYTLSVPVENIGVTYMF